MPDDAQSDEEAAPSLPDEYALVFFDKEGEVQVGVEGHGMTRPVVTQMLGIAHAKMNLLNLRIQQKQVDMQSVILP